LEWLRTVHIGCAVISITGFVIRGILMMIDAKVMQTRWIRIVPHIVDVTLLGSAIAIALQYGFTLKNSPWLTAKIVGLLVYIGLGFVALRKGKTKWVRIVAWLAALLVFGYIVAVAMDKSPLPFM
jgi:uncharacterized membrane protein SirB2